MSVNCVIFCTRLPSSAKLINLPFRVCHVAMSYMVIVLMALEVGMKDIALIIIIFYLTHMQNWLKDAECLVMPAIRCLNFLGHMILMACLLNGERTISFQISTR